MPTLYLVGTPIGNLEDITLRALRLLKEVGLVAAEDTRRARRLFARHGITTRLVSYHEQGQRSRAGPILRHLAEQDAAFITEAGMPSMSDPGYALVHAALRDGHRVEVVPGPSAITAALAVSGLPADQFIFLGFLPRKAQERLRLLERLREEPRTLVAFEAPHRLVATLHDIDATLGDRPLAVARELTKVHEEVFRGTAKDALAHFLHPRGESTLVIGGYREARPGGDVAQARARLATLRGEGLTGRDAVARVATETGLRRREVYALWVKEMGR